MADLGAGSQFGAYRIEGIAGQGGMGVVYRATQVGLDRTVALKVITPAFAHDPEFRERFKRESRLAASIEHPNVIPVYEAGEQDEVLFMAMRYIDGTDVKSLLVREGRLEPVRAARFVAQIAAALDAAHSAGLVHRDVKPANALLATDDHVYLTDFGLTKRAASGSAMTKTGQMVGTVDYVAPEQVDGRAVDARTDVYSLACVLFHLVTGRVPFDKPSEMAKLYSHVHEDPPAPSEHVPGLPPEIDAVVARGMAKDPADRFLSAGDLGRAAVAAAEHRAVAVPDRSVARGEAAPSAASAATVIDGSTPVGAVAPGAAAAASGAAAAASGAAAATSGRGAADASERGDPPGAGAPSRRRNALIAAGLGALLLVVVGIVLLGGGDGGEGDGSASSGDSGTAVEVTRSNALDSASTFADGVNEQNITNFEDLYKGDFSQEIDVETCSGAQQPMDLDAALAEWQCMFDAAGDDEYGMKLTKQRTDLSTKTLTADYAMTHDGDQIAAGKVSFHLIPGDDFPRMDKVVFSGGDGSLALAGASGDAAPKAELTRAAGLSTVTTFADYFEDENLGGFESLFATGFKQTVKGPACSDAKSPMNIDAALGEYQCRFDELTLPEMTTSGARVDLGSDTVTARYELTDEGKDAGSGTVKMHLLPQPNDAQPKVDRLELTAAR